jgi:hypothetical protein
MHRFVGTDRPRAPKRPDALRLTDAGTLPERHARPQTDPAAPGAIEPSDPRWVLAVEVARNLQGGRAAILTPERRARAMNFAREMGLRPFDASLVIAIVQDAARTNARPLGGMPADVHSRLSLVGAPESVQPAATPSLWPAVVSAGVLAVAIFSALVAWVGL